MRENLLADSFIRKVLMLFLILFLSSAAYLNSIYFFHIKEYVSWEALREGGVVIMPHTHALGADNPYKFRLGDCSTQIILSETGRNQARKIGKRFRENGIDVGIVLHSRWCRTRETASLAFPGITVAESSLDSFRLRPEHESFYTRQAEKIIGRWRSSNALVLTTHPENILALTGMRILAGEAVVLKNLKNNIEIVGKIKF